MMDPPINCIRYNPGLGPTAGAAPFVCPPFCEWLFFIKAGFGRGSVNTTFPGNPHLTSTTVTVVHLPRRPAPSPSLPPLTPLLVVAAAPPPPP